MIPSPEISYKLHIKEFRPPKPVANDPYQLFQYLRHIKNKYPEEEDVDEAQRTPYLHGQPFAKGNTENMQFTRAIDWEEASPPDAINIYGVHESYEIILTIIPITPLVVSFIASETFLSQNLLTSVT